MKRSFVTDTHPIVWLAADRRKLGRAAARAFAAYEEGQATLFVPAPVVLETWFLRKNGRIRERTSVGSWWAAIASPALAFEPMTAEDVVEAERLAWRHDDVYDRLIVACAVRLGLPLITADSAITDSKLVDVVW